MQHRDGSFCLTILANWETTLNFEVCLKSREDVFQQRAVMCGEGRERKFERLCLSFVLSLSLQPIGSIVYFSELLLLCARQKNVLQCTLEEFRRITPPFKPAGVNQFLCSSCWIELLSVKRQITNSNSFQHNKDNRVKDFWGGGGFTLFPSSYRYLHNPKCLCMKHKHCDKEIHIHTNPPSVTYSRYFFSTRLRL